MACSADDLAEMVQALGPEEALGNLKVAQLREYCKAFGLEPARLKLDVIEQLGKYLQEVWSTREAAAAAAATTGASKRGCKASSDEKKGKKPKCSVDVESLKEAYVDESQTGATVNQHASNTTRVASPLRKRTRKTAAVASEQSSVDRTNVTSTVDSDQKAHALLKRKRVRVKTATGVDDRKCADATSVDASVPADEESVNSCGAESSQPQLDTAKPWLSSLLATRFMSEAQLPGGPSPLLRASVAVAGVTEQHGSDGQHRCEEKDTANMEKKIVRTNVASPTGAKLARGELTYEAEQDRDGDEHASKLTCTPGADAAVERSRDDTDDANLEHGSPRKEDASEREEEDSEDGEETADKEQVHDQTCVEKGMLVEQEMALTRREDASERDDEEEGEETDKDEHTEAAEEAASIADNVIVPPRGVPLPLGEEHSMGKLTHGAMQEQERDEHASNLTKLSAGACATIERSRDDSDDAHSEHRSPRREDAREREEQDSEEGEVMRDVGKVHGQTCDEKDELVEQEEEVPRREVSERDDEDENDDDDDMESEATEKEDTMGELSPEGEQDQEDEEHASKWTAFALGASVAVERSRNDTDDANSEHATLRKQDASDEGDSEASEGMDDEEQVQDKKCDEKDELAEQEEKMPRREDANERSDDDVETEVPRKDDEDHTVITDVAIQSAAQEATSIADDVFVPPTCVPLPLGEERSGGELTHGAMHEQERDEHASKLTVRALGASVAVERSRDDSHDAHSEHRSPRDEDASEREEENSDEGGGMGGEEQVHDQTSDENDELVKQDEEMSRRGEASEKGDDDVETEPTRKEDEKHTNITDVASQSAAQEASSDADDVAAPPGSVPLPLSEERTSREMACEAVQDQEGDEHASRLTAPALGASVAAPRKQDTSEVDDSEEGEVICDKTCDEKDELVEQGEEMLRREEASERDDHDSDAEGEATGKENKEHTNIRYFASQEVAEEASSIAVDVAVPFGGAAVGEVHSKEIFPTCGVETIALASSSDANVGFAASTMSTETLVMCNDASLVSCDFASGVVAEKSSDSTGNQAANETRMGDVDPHEHELIVERRIDAGCELPGVAFPTTDTPMSSVQNDAMMAAESMKCESASADESMEDEEEEDLQRTGDPAEIDEDTGDEGVNACVAAMGEVYDACAAAGGHDDLEEASDADAHVYDVRADGKAAVITEAPERNTDRSAVEAGADLRFQMS